MTKILPITHVGGTGGADYFYPVTVFTSEETAAEWAADPRQWDRDGGRRFVRPVLSMKLGSPLVGRTSLVDVGAE